MSHLEKLSIAFYYDFDVYYLSNIYNYKFDIMMKNKKIN